jgi:hypothetical protein
VPELDLVTARKGRDLGIEKALKIINEMKAGIKKEE